MRKLLSLTAASALVASLISVAYVNGVFDRDISVSFDSAAIDMPKILLLPADSKECQRRRTLDDFGGAIDNIDMSDGSTKVIVYNRLPKIKSVTAYYPAAGYESCESFAKQGPQNLNNHGQMATLDERDHTSLKPERTRQYNRQGHLERAGNLIEGGTKFQTDFFNLAGLITRSETYALVKKRNESETSYRADGTRLMRQTLPSTETSFYREHFSADGKILVMKEDRSYGHYGLSLMHPNGQTNVSALKSISVSELNYFRTDGTIELQVKLFSGRMVSFKHFDQAGKKQLDSTWREGTVGTPDANGYRPLVLWRINEVNSEGRATREFVYRPDGTLEKVTFYKNSNYFEVSAEYKCDDQGKVISSQAADKDGNKLPEIVYGADEPNRPTFTMPTSYFAQPQFTVPAGFSKYDSQIAEERPNIHDR